MQEKGWEREEKEQRKRLNQKRKMKKRDRTRETFSGYVQSISTFFFFASSMFTSAVLLPGKYIIFFFVLFPFAALLAFSFRHDVSMQEMCDGLMLRLTNPSWIVVLKTLIVFHRLLRDGHEVCPLIFGGFFFGLLVFDAGAWWVCKRKKKAKEMGTGCQERKRERGGWGCL